jgi:hypothetical protein
MQDVREEMMCSSPSLSAVLGMRGKGRRPGTGSLDWWKTRNARCQQRIQLGSCRHHQHQDDTTAALTVSHCINAIHRHCMSDAVRWCIVPVSASSFAMSAAAGYSLSLMGTVCALSQSMRYCAVFCFSRCQAGDSWLCSTCTRCCCCRKRRARVREAEEERDERERRGEEKEEEEENAASSQCSSSSSSSILPVFTSASS